MAIDDGLGSYSWNGSSIDDPYEGLRRQNEREAQKKKYEALLAGSLLGSGGSAGISGGALGSTFAYVRREVLEGYKKEIADLKSQLVERDEIIEALSAELTEMSRAPEPVVATNPAVPPVDKWIEWNGDGGCPLEGIDDDRTVTVCISGGATTGREETGRAKEVRQWRWYHEMGCPNIVAYKLEPLPDDGWIKWTPFLGAACPVPRGKKFLCRLSYAGDSECGPYIAPYMRWDYSGGEGDISSYKILD